VVENISFAGIPSIPGGAATFNHCGSVGLPFGPFGSSQFVAPIQLISIYIPTTS
jgi:hypothetical protein